MTTPPKKKIGRPKGSKNAVTLVKEAAIQKALRHCSNYAVMEAPKVIEAMAKKAQGGDVPAARLVLEVARMVGNKAETGPKTNPSITINITGDASIGASENGIDSTGSTPDPLPEVPAHGKESDYPQGGQVVTVNAGPEGERQEPETAVLN